MAEVTLQQVLDMGDGVLALRWLRANAERLAEMEKDAARLDWIDENGMAIRSRENGHKNLTTWNYNADGRQVKLRARIDAAMAGSGEEAGNG